MNNPIHEQEIFLLRPYFTFASLKEVFLNVSILCASQNIASVVTDKSLYWKSIFFISHPNICCGYSKEPSQ